MKTTFLIFAILFILFSCTSSTKNSDILLKNYNLEYEVKNLKIQPIKYVETNQPYYFSFVYFLFFATNTQYNDSTLDDKLTLKELKNNMLMPNVSIFNLRKTYTINYHGIEKSISFAHILDQVPDAELLLYPSISSECEKNTFTTIPIGIPFYSYGKTCNVKISALAAKYVLR